MNNFLASKGVSLACAILNGIFAISAFTNGSILMAIICSVLCGYCTNNYLKH